MRYFQIIGFLLIFGCNYSDPALSTEEVAQLQFKLHKAISIKDSETDSSFLLTQETLILSRESNFPEGIAGSSLILGEICFEKGEYKKANAYLVEALNIFESLEDYAAIAQSHNLIGQVFQHNDRFDLARMNYIQALATYQRVNNLQGIAQSYGNLGHLNEKKSQYDSAIYFNLLAKELYQQLGDSIGIASIYDNIGSVYEDLANFDQAKANFERAFLINTALGNVVEALINKNNIADTYRKTGQHQQALSNYLKVIDEAKQLNQPYQLKSAYRDVSRTYSLINEFEMGFLYLDSCYEVADELATQEIVRGIEETRSIYELERQQRQIELLEKNRRISLIIRVSLIGLTSLLIIIGALIFLQLQTRMKKNQQLFEAEKQLARVREEQLESDLNFKKLQEEKMYQEMESMSQELTSNALSIIRKNKFLDQVKRELKNIKTSKDEALNKSLKKVIRSINQTFSIDEDWLEFETVFQQVHIHFYEQLRKQHPDLTPTETKLCALMRLNLDSKDMATIMGISSDSLRIARYRLRKKLKLEKGANLYSFLMSIG